MASSLLRNFSIRAFFASFSSMTGSSFPSKLDGINSALQDPQANARALRWLQECLPCASSTREEPSPQQPQQPYFQRTGEAKLRNLSSDGYRYYTIVLTYTICYILWYTIVYTYSMLYNTIVYNTVLCCIALYYMLI